MEDGRWVDHLTFNICHLPFARIELRSKGGKGGKTFESEARKKKQDIEHLTTEPSYYLTIKLVCLLLSTPGLMILSMIIDAYFYRATSTVQLLPSIFMILDSSFLVLYWQNYGAKFSLGDYGRRTQRHVNGASRVG